MGLTTGGLGSWVSPVSGFVLEGQGQASWLEGVGKPGV